jgi:hypothetical protein
LDTSAGLLLGTHETQAAAAAVHGLAAAWLSGGRQTLLSVLLI